MQNMRPADLTRLVLLAAIWGGSFLFVRMAAVAIGPVVARIDGADAVLVIDDLGHGACRK